MKDTITEVIKEYIADNPDINNTSLADLILEDGAITGKSHRTIRKYIGDIKLVQMAVNIDEESTSQPTGEIYGWDDPKNEVIFSGDTGTSGGISEGISEGVTDEIEQITEQVIEETTEQVAEQVEQVLEQATEDFTDTEAWALVNNITKGTDVVVGNKSDYHTTCKVSAKGTPVQLSIYDVIDQDNSEKEKVVKMTEENIEEAEDIVMESNDYQFDLSPYSVHAVDTMVGDGFEVKNLTYIFTISKKEYKYSVELIDKIFCAYSRRGLNLTKHQIVAGLNVDFNDFNIISNKLNLTKESNTFGPFTDEFMEPEDIYAAVMNNTRSLLNMVTDNDSAALEGLIKEYKNAYVELCSRNLKFDSFMKELSLKLDVLDLNYSDTVITKVKPFMHGIESMTVIITDMHMGLSMPHFNYEIAKQKLLKIAEDINSIGAKSVTISFLGDVMHTISGVNHANMWKTIEQGAWGANAITTPFEILMLFFSKVANLAKVTSVSGNHDRMHNDRNLEESNEGAKLLFYMIKTALNRSAVEVTHTDHRTIHSDGSLVFINLHGDQGLDKKSSEKIIWKYGDQSKFNFILEGHYHSRSIGKEDDGSNFRKMYCPAFCPTDGYAEGLGLDSTAGWLMIMERDGLPIVIDVPINYAARK